MPEVRPLAAIRFNFDKLGRDVSSLIAPPYDVLDQGDKDALLARSEHNIVAIDLPHIPPKSAGLDEVYQRAAATLNTWLDDGTLVREKQPAIYVYHQQFEHAGRTFSRRKIIARVRLAAFSEGSILPHEKTFGGPKEDRLALMKATRCQLSPIFGLYTDAEDRIGTAMASIVNAEPSGHGLLSGVNNRLWIVTDSDAIATVTRHLADKPVYIADGHHRYSTAMMYRDWLCEGNGGSIADDHPANFVMFVLASMDDPGCMILPYHRALAGVDLATVCEALHDGAVPTERSNADVILVDGTTGEERCLRFSNRERLRSLEPDQCEPWYDLDYAYLHRYLIDELLSKSLSAQPRVRYVKSEEDAKCVAREENGVAVLMNATPMAHLRAVSECGGLMPQKSTYFYPKLATGLAINPLA